MCFSLQHLQEMGSGSVGSLEVEQQPEVPSGTAGMTSRGGKSGSRGQKMTGSSSRGKVIFRRPDLKGISKKKKI